MSIANIKSLPICKECKGNGYIRGSLNAATCIFCFGSGHSNHASRVTYDDMLSVFEMCENYVKENKKDYTQ